MRGSLLGAVQVVLQFVLRSFWWPMQMMPNEVPAAARHNLAPTSPRSCPEPARFTLVLYSLSVVLTSLMSFSPEALRRTAANVDQGASDKKAQRATEAKKKKKSQQNADDAGPA